MPYKDLDHNEIITLWVPKGIKRKLRIVAAEEGYKGVFELLREYIDSGLKKNDNGILAYCSITFDEALTVENIRILERNNKFIIAMPSVKTNKVDTVTGKPIYKDVFYPITKEWRDKIEASLLNAYYGQIQASEISTGKINESGPSKEFTRK